MNLENLTATELNELQNRSLIYNRALGECERRNKILMNALRLAHAALLETPCSDICNELLPCIRCAAIQEIDLFRFAPMQRSENK